MLRELEVTEHDIGSFMGSRSFLSVYTGYSLRERRVSDKSHQTHSDDFAWLFDMLQIPKKYFLSAGHLLNS